MRTYDFWTRWLAAVGWILVAFGLIIALLNQTPAFDQVFNRYVDRAFWSTRPIPADAARFQAWVYGILGATVAGWGIFVAFLARHPLRRRERWAWRCVLVGITLWFVIDTALSLRFGVTVNVLINCILALLVYAPLVAMRRGLE